MPSNAPTYGQTLARKAEAFVHRTLPGGGSATDSALGRSSALPHLLQRAEASPPGSTRSRAGFPAGQTGRKLLGRLLERADASRGYSPGWHMLACLGRMDRYPEFPASSAFRYPISPPGFSFVLPEPEAPTTGAVSRRRAGASSVPRLAFAPSRQAQASPYSAHGSWIAPGKATSTGLSSLLHPEARQQPAPASYGMGAALSRPLVGAGLPPVASASEPATRPLVGVGLAPASAVPVSVHLPEPGVGSSPAARPVLLRYSPPFQFVQHGSPFVQGRQAPGQASFSGQQPGSTIHAGSRLLRPAAPAPGQSPGGFSILGAAPLSPGTWGRPYATRPGAQLGIHLATGTPRVEDTGFPAITGSHGDGSRRRPRLALRPLGTMSFPVVSLEPRIPAPSPIPGHIPEISPPPARRPGTSPAQQPRPSLSPRPGALQPMGPAPIPAAVAARLAIPPSPVQGRIVSQQSRARGLGYLQEPPATEARRTIGAVAASPSPPATHPMARTVHGHLSSRSMASPGMVSPGMEGPAFSQSPLSGGAAAAFQRAMALAPSADRPHFQLPGASPAFSHLLARSPGESPPLLRKAPRYATSRQPSAAFLPVAPALSPETPGTPRGPAGETSHLPQVAGGYRAPSWASSSVTTYLNAPSTPDMTEGQARYSPGAHRDGLSRLFSAAYFPTPPGAHGSSFARFDLPLHPSVPAPTPAAHISPAPITRLPPLVPDPTAIHGPTVRAPFMANLRGVQPLQEPALQRGSAAPAGTVSRPPASIPLPATGQAALRVDSRWPYRRSLLSAPPRTVPSRYLRAPSPPGLGPQSRILPLPRSMDRWTPAPRGRAESHQDERAESHQDGEALTSLPRWLPTQARQGQRSGLGAQPAAAGLAPRHLLEATSMAPLAAAPVAGGLGPRFPRVYPGERAMAFARFSGHGTSPPSAGRSTPRLPGQPREVAPGSVSPYSAQGRAARAPGSVSPYSAQGGAARAPGSVSPYSAQGRAARAPGSVSPASAQGRAARAPGSVSPASAQGQTARIPAARLLARRAAGTHPVPHLGRQAISLLARQESTPAPGIGEAGPRTDNALKQLFQAMSGSKQPTELLEAIIAQASRPGGIRIPSTTGKALLRLRDRLAGTGEGARHGRDIRPAAPSPTTTPLRRAGQGGDQRPAAPSPTTALPGAAPPGPTAPQQVVQLVTRLQDLVHLVELEGRLSQARSQVRMAEDSPVARSEGAAEPTPAGATAGSPNSLQAESSQDRAAASAAVEQLTRQVWELVSREMELRRERSMGEPRDGDSYLLI